jgi:hypothetical protein
MLEAERLLVDGERALREWNGLLVPPRCIVLQDLPVQALRFGEVAFLRTCCGQHQERKQEDSSDVPSARPTPVPTIHRGLSSINRRQACWPYSALAPDKINSERQSPAPTQLEQNARRTRATKLRKED